MRPTDRHPLVIIGLLFVIAWLVFIMILIIDTRFA
jgi:hypothetical protein